MNNINKNTTEYGTINNAPVVPATPKRDNSRINFFGKVTALNKYHGASKEFMKITCEIIDGYNEIPTTIDVLSFIPAVYENMRTDMLVEVSAYTSVQNKTWHGKKMSYNHLVADNITFIVSPKSYEAYEE